MGSNPLLKLQIWHLLQARSSLTFRQTMECRFTLQLEHDMITTYSQMHHTDKYSQQSPIIWPVWLNGWVFIYKLSGCGFKSCCCHLNLESMFVDFKVYSINVGTLRCRKSEIVGKLECRSVNLLCIRDKTLGRVS